MSELVGPITIILCVTGISLAGKSCNDSDNRLKQEAINKGCSILKINDHQQINCPGSGLKMEIK